MVSLLGTKPDNPAPEVKAESQPLQESVLDSGQDTVAAGGIVEGDVRPFPDSVPANQGFFDPNFDGTVAEGMVEGDVIDLDEIDSPS